MQSMTTEVYVQNNTVHSFPVRDSVSQPRSHPLPTGAHRWNTDRIGAGERMELLRFERGYAIDNGQEYIFNSKLFLGSSEVDLRQRVRGTLLHSDLWQSAANEAWFNDRDWHYAGWQTDEGTIEILYRAYFTGGDDSIEYVLNPPPFLGHESEDVLDVLAYNIYMLPTTIRKTGQDKRADLLPVHIRNYDVIIFSEAFDDDVRAELLRHISTEYPFQTSILGSDTFPLAQDGGVIIVSRWPIDPATEDQVVFKDQNLIPISGELCRDSDCNADKGVVYAQITKGDRKFHIFGSHSQASYPGTSGWRYEQIRARQFQIIKAFIDSKNIPPDEAVIIGGDLNVDRTNRVEFENMKRILNAEFPQRQSGHAFTVDPSINELSGGDHQEYLDYVLYSRAHLQPLNASIEARILRSRFPWKEYFWEDEIWELSDHFPVSCTLQYGRPEFRVTPIALDFGNVLKGTVATRDEAFTVASTGTAPVTIQGITVEGPQAATFSVTPSPPSSFPAELQPGSTFPIRVSFTSRAPGQHRATIVVTGLQLLGTPVQILVPMVAYVTAPYLNVLPTTINFGFVAVGESEQRILLVENAGDAELHYSLPPTLQREFYWRTGTLGASRTLAPGASETIPVRFEPTRTGSQEHRITIESNDRTATVLLLGEGIPPPVPQISVAPPQLNFGVVYVGRTATLDLTVTNTGAAPLTVSELRIEGPARALFALTGQQARTVQPGQSAVVQVTFTPTTMTAGGHRANLVIVTNAENTPQQSVELFGMGATSDIEVTPTEIKFNNSVLAPHLPLGLGERRSFDIYNRGSAPLTVTGSSFRVIDFGTGQISPHFQILDERGRVFPQNDVLLNAGDSLSLSLQFRPVALGNHPATITITSSDTAQSEVVIEVSGRGVQ